jgi:hypothetical protein
LKNNNNALCLCENWSYAMALIFTTQCGCFYILVATEWPNLRLVHRGALFPPFDLDAFTIEWGHDMVCIFICCWEGFYLYEDIINIVWMYIVTSMMSHGTWILQWVWVNTLQLPHHVGWLLELWMHVTNRFQFRIYWWTQFIAKGKMFKFVCVCVCVCFFWKFSRCGLLKKKKNQCQDQLFYILIKLL